MIIQHNLAAMNTNRQFGINNRSKTKSIEKLSSGYKINRAADNAAGLSMSEKMRRQIRGLNQASFNVQEGIGLCQVLDGGMAQIHDLLQRQNELCIKGANGTLTDVDRSYVQAEIEALTTEVDRTARETTYNDLNVLNRNVAYKRGEEHVEEVTTLPLSEVDWSTLPEDSRKVDVAFIMDTTGSMGTALVKARNSINDFVDTLSIGGLDLNLILVDYKDTVDDTYPAKVYEFGDDVSAFKAKLATFTATGGGDNPESGLEAIMDIKDVVSTRPDSQIQYVLITDADVHTSSDGKSSLTIGGVTDYLVSKDITLHLLGSSTASAQLGSMVTSSSGNIYDLAGSFGTIFEDIGMDILTKAAKKGGIDKAYSYDMYESDPMPVFVQASSESGIHIGIPIPDCRASNLGIDKVSCSTALQAENSINMIKNALHMISSYRTKVGAVQNRLEHTMDNLNNISENTSAADSAIRDTDMATEMVKFSKHNILEQAGQSMMTQANSKNQGVLSLLQ